MTRRLHTCDTLDRDMETVITVSLCCLRPLCFLRPHTKHMRGYTLAPTSVEILWWSALDKPLSARMVSVPQKGTPAGPVLMLALEGMARLETSADGPCGGGRRGEMCQTSPPKDCTFGKKNVSGIGTPEGRR